MIKSSWTKTGLEQNPDLSMWRYHPLLPVSQVPDNTSLRVGGTPLVNLPKIANQHGLSTFQIKDDTRNPSGSLKDRASEVGIQHALELGKDTIVGASTGNAGSSLAALAAHHGFTSVIFAPANAPPAKLAQIRQHGAKLIAIDSNYDRAFDLAIEWTKLNNHYSRNTGYNPILAEGKKTVAFEIAEQNNWQVPDHIFIPVGDGCIISGVYKGFFDLLALDWIDHMPRLHPVQAHGSAAIVNSLSREGAIESVQAQTLADSISVDKPRDGEKARRAILASGGVGFKVSDDEILSAQQALSGSTGLFAEPAAAAAYAGFLQASEKIFFNADDKVTVLITGTGLKDIPAAQKNLGSLEIIPAEISEIENYLSRDNK
ncbi:threonine synthase [bacterium]|nr:threonine synthase [bacterium]